MKDLENEQKKADTPIFSLALHCLDSKEKVNQTPVTQINR